ncbi:hypothetical protein PG996_008687 [Apiospora saccharicola]|uniref:C2H2-type domain-containing protein n=1 Tax=Apiospora saccharicola TaxID=335842 RepID=A0ABR1UYM1_9PEZI
MDPNKNDEKSNKNDEKNNKNDEQNNNNGGHVTGDNAIQYQGKYHFRGVIEGDGRVYCLDCRERSGASHRGMKNLPKDIASHMSKFHANGAYQRDQARDPDNEWLCACSFKAQSWHSFLAHIRGSHGFVGDSSHVQRSGVLPHYTKGVTPNGATVEEKKEEKKKQKQDEKEKEKDSVPEDTPYWQRDQYHQGGNGRGGDGGGMAA